MAMRWRLCTSISTAIRYCPPCGERTEEKPRQSDVHYENLLDATPLTRLGWNTEISHCLWSSQSTFLCLLQQHICKEYISVACSRISWPLRHCGESHHVPFNTKAKEVWSILLIFKEKENASSHCFIRTFKRECGDASAWSTGWKQA